MTEHIPDATSVVVHDRAEAPASQDGPGDRRGFLRCMAWAGTGMLWTMAGGVPRSSLLGATPPTTGELFFAQLSDSHIGFDKAANADVTATMRAAVGRLNALPIQPSFLLHTGDITQLAKPAEFDTAAEVMKEARTRDAFFVPGEHDVATDNGKSYLERYGRQARSTGTGGWYSFDHSGVHFMALVNVLDLKPGGLGALGREQLEWIERDTRHLSSSTPIVVFAHVPLWSVYPAWGWGTDDGAVALGYLKRFGSVTVLNGHIHQTMQKVEGNVTFHTAMSTAFPQPRPGTAPAPGPMVVPPGQLRDVLGIARVRYVPHHGHLAIVDESISGAAPEAAMAAGETRARGAAATATAPAGEGAVSIDNFAFSPNRAHVRAGQPVTWTNRDDVPHRIQSTTGAFAPSTVLDTKGTYSIAIGRAGTYPYFCSLHPTMTGAVVVG